MNQATNLFVVKNIQVSQSFIYLQNGSNKICNFYSNGIISWLVIFHPEWKIPSSSLIHDFVRDLKIRLGQISLNLYDH